jgi:hypothetical protein
VGYGGYVFPGFTRIGEACEVDLCFWRLEVERKRAVFRCIPAAMIEIQHLSIFFPYNNGQPHLLLTPNGLHPPLPLSLPQHKQVKAQVSA